MDTAINCLMIEEQILLCDTTLIINSTTLLNNNGEVIYITSNIDSWIWTL